MPVRIVEAAEWTQTLRIQAGALEGTLVRLEVDDELTEVTARTADGREIGHLRFRLFEGDDDHHIAPYYKLVWAHLNFLGAGYTHQGIGHAALRFWNGLSGQAAAVERHTGIPNDEGSHLTGDAPGFVARMVDAGLLYYEDGAE
jgi:hypothetical protein